MKVLVIRFSSIGDIVLTTPVIRCLKTQRPDIELHYLTKHNFHSLLKHNPHIDKLHLLNDSLDNIVESLKAEKFDAIIDLHHNLRTMRVKKALGVESFSFPKLNIQKWLYTWLKFNIMPDKSIVDRYFEPVSHLNVRNDGKGLDYFIPDDKALGNNDIPMSHWGGYIGCVIGGSCGTKKLPIEQWITFCKNVPYPVMLLGGPEDTEMGTAIADVDPIKIYNSCGKFDLNESAGLVKYARVIVSNDTGLMHIAAAFDKPIVSLWGNTAPEMGMFPYYGDNNLTDKANTKSVIIENKNVGCHPCSKIGYKQCPLGHFNCMKKLEMAEVSDQATALWEKSE